MGLDQANRMSEELWAEVHNTAQGAVNKTVTKKMKCKKTK